MKTYPSPRKDMTAREEAEWFRQHIAELRARPRDESEPRFDARSSPKYRDYPHFQRLGASFFAADGRAARVASRDGVVQGTMRGFHPVADGGVDAVAVELADGWWAFRRHGDWEHRSGDRATVPETWEPVTAWRIPASSSEEEVPAPDKTVEWAVRTAKYQDDIDYYDEMAAEGKPGYTPEPPPIFET
jgi:hypothetical protein